MADRRSGAAAEREACRFLESSGLRLITRNYRCPRGEIDLIMNDGGTFVFVEVRYRTSVRYGSPAETVNAAKQGRLAAAARHYLQTHGAEPACRFDVVSITPDKPVEWIRDAFHTA